MELSGTCSPTFFMQEGKRALFSVQVFSLTYSFPLFSFRGPEKLRLVFMSLPPSPCIIASRRSHTWSGLEHGLISCNTHHHTSHEHSLFSPPFKDENCSELEKARTDVHSPIFPLFHIPWSRTQKLTPNWIEWPCKCVRVISDIGEGGLMSNGREATCAVYALNGLNKEV